MKTYATDPFDLDYTLLDYTELQDEEASQHHIIRALVLARMQEEDPLIDGTEEPLH